MDATEGKIILTAIKNPLYFCESIADFMMKNNLVFITEIFVWYDEAVEPSPLNY